METIKFKTNIKCGSCIATVTPHLNALSEIDKWEVDTLAADKVLTVEADTDGVTQQVIDSLEKAGFKAELIW